MSVQKLLKMKCDIYRKGEIKDDYGNVIQAFTLKYSDIPCYLERMSRREQSSLVTLTETGQDITRKYIGVFAPDIDLQKKDRIVCSYYNPSTLYVSDATPVFNPRVGKTSQVEAILGIEEL